MESWILSSETISLRCSNIAGNKGSNSRLNAQAPPTEGQEELWRMSEIMQRCMHSFSKSVDFSAKIECDRI